MARFFFLYFLYVVLFWMTMIVTYIDIYGVNGYQIMTVYFTNETSFLTTNSIIKREPSTVLQ